MSGTPDFDISKIDIATIIHPVCPKCGEELQIIYSDPVPITYRCTNPKCDWGINTQLTQSFVSTGVDAKAREASQKLELLREWLTKQKAVASKNSDEEYRQYQMDQQPPTLGDRTHYYEHLQWCGVLDGFEKVEAYLTYLDTNLNVE